MRRFLLTTILLVATCSSVQAEDFTGFYAGLNAGYARGHDRTAHAHGTGDGLVGDRSDTGPDLPPSAREAAATLRTPFQSMPRAAIGR